MMQRQSENKTTLDAGCSFENKDIQHAELFNSWKIQKDSYIIDVVTENSKIA